MSELEQLIRSVKKNSVVVGDFNLPDVNWVTGEASRRSSGVVEAVDDKMLEQMVAFPTHVKGNTLDLVLTDIPERVSDVSPGGRLGHSDHEIVNITVECAGSQEVIKEVRNWRRADWEKMRADLRRVRWQPTLQGKTVDQMWTALKGKVLAAVRKHVPTRKVRNGGKPVWMRKEILVAIRKKKRLWARAKEGNGMEEYKREEKRVKNMIRNAKRKFEKRLADGGKGNSRPFYAYIKRRTKARPTVGPLKDGQGKTVTDDGEMAELLNGFFSSVFTREDPSQLPEAEMGNQVPKMPSVGFTEWDVRKKIRRLRKEAAAGPDEMGPRLLQELEDVIVKPLTNIFKESLLRGQVPEDWKKANVTPIFKKGGKAEPGNYRPVSLTSVCGKVLESIIRDRIVDHLVRNGLIKESQHGFMNGKSCCTNLLEYLEEATRAADEGKPFDMVFLDFAKAFDKVPRERLLLKMRSHGLGEDVLAWIRAWLTGRTQRVVLNGRSSSWKEVLSGVPQGSVLGPILFLIFINDLEDGTEGLVDIIRKFADDTKLGHKVGTQEARENLQKALDALCAWSDKWGMEFNIGKCKTMHIGHNNPQHTYTMKGQALQKTSDETDIGVKVTSTLKPSAQCQRAARTAQTVLSQLGRAFHYRDRHIFVRLYVQYVRPHLEFASPAWSPWQEADKECLEKVQKRAVSMISGLASALYEERLKELGLTTLEERRHQLDMLQTYKILAGRDKVDKRKWFVMSSESDRQTRATADPLSIRIPANRLEIRRQFYSQRVPDQWNKIPLEIRKAPTPWAFKRAYKAHRRAIADAARLR
jgi:hypothetical protein